MKIFNNRYAILAGLMMVLMLSSCIKEKTVNCYETTGTFICFDGEGREATYARWNFDTVSTFNAFNIQGGYPAVPGTTGPWTIVNLTFVNSAGNMLMELGNYNYNAFLNNTGSREFTFWLKRYSGEAQTPIVKNFEMNPYNGGTANLSITNVDGSGNLTGLFEANVRNVNDTTETGVVKFLFTDIEPQ